MTNPTVRDVARKASVSATTVSNFYNHPDRLSAQTLETVSKAIQALNYRRNTAAIALRRAGQKRADEVRDGHLPERPSTIKDIATLTHLSYQTVSRALNHPETVRPVTLSKVLAGVKQLNFRRNANAVTLRRPSS